MRVKEVISKYRMFSDGDVFIGRVPSETDALQHLPFGSIRNPEYGELMQMTVVGLNTVENGLVIYIKA